MPDKLSQYRHAQTPPPTGQRLWPLYGAGFENLGQEDSTIPASVPSIGPDDLLVRHDAVGLCFSDTKVIKLGQDHPRIYRDMQTDPVVLGHEVSMTVIQVGENLRGQYRAGDRFIVQADIFVDGVGYAYGYEIQGGLSQYNRLDQRVLNGDDGNYLIPVQPSTGYAESALTEPWACVIAAYQLRYRTGLKPGGTTWIIGAGESQARSYTISAGFDEHSHPARLVLSCVPPAFEAWLRTRAGQLGIEVIAAPDVTQPPQAEVDDIVVLGADPDLVETVSPHLAHFGILAILAEGPMARKVNVDVGRVHYNRWVYVGSRGSDVAAAYSATPVRATLKPGGKAWFVGAGGPMGRMHVQRAIQVSNGPGEILCTDVSDLRLGDLCDSFAAEAEAKGIRWNCVNPTDKETYRRTLESHAESGFDDIIVLAPIPVVISEAAGYLAPKGVMNVFAGLNRGMQAALELSDVYLKDVRVIGHSASTIDDLRLMLHQAESGELSPNRSVAAVGSLNAAKDGLAAVRDTRYPGKVVIYPQIKEFPLTALPDLKDSLPSVWALLKDGREWTVEAEAEFLRLMLP
ncbi:MAG: alcohol dehydrogenase catalytic domain-containing protein [Chloroflexi bacterium]|nr:alcohol dehydrogenase catalytic domain-containing protein [Chloroflexota bacterium]